MASIKGARGVVAEIARIVTPNRKTDRLGPSGSHIDLSGIAADPDKAIDLARDHGPETIPMLEVPLSTLRRNHLGISIDDHELNPFTRSVDAYLSGAHTEYPGSDLQHFFAAWQPRTLAEFAGVGIDDLRSPLARPLMTGDMPWDRYRSIVELRKERDVYELERRAKFGKAPAGRHGYDYFGPTSDALGEYRFNKHARVARTIAEEGFEAEGHLIDVQLLAGEGSWALLVRDGKHRTTALASLHVPHVFVAMPPTYPVIRRAEVESWPGVSDGLYNVEEALQVFDRHVAGRPPAGFPESSEYR